MNEKDAAYVMKGICYIVGSGDFTSRGLIKNEGDYIIAADGGYRHLTAAGFRPDLLVGDFDSLPFVPERMEICRFPTEKDDTDMGLAISKGMERGYRRFRLYGGSGSRPDHFYANLQLLLRCLNSALEAKLVCPDFTVHAVKNGEITLTRAAGTVFSVFSAEEQALGVCIQGAKYELKAHTLKNDFPIGVSNEFIGNSVSISVKTGCLLIFEYTKPDIQ